MEYDEDNPGEYPSWHDKVLSWAQEIGDNEKSFWEWDLQRYIDERHKCIWVLGELNNRRDLNNRYANRIIFEQKAIEDFVQDWFRIPARFYAFSRAMNSAVRGAQSARELALAASTVAKESSRLAGVFALSEPVNNIINYRGQTYLREDGVRVKHGYGVIRSMIGDHEDNEFDEAEVEESDLSIYSGQFVDGEKSGTGIESYDMGIYKGSYFTGQSNGHGIEICYPDESRTGVVDEIYLGHWENDTRSGLGVEIQTLEVFSGSWKSDLRSGPGRSTMDTFAIKYAHLEGFWVDGKVDGMGREIQYDRVHEGTFKDSEMNRLGKVRFFDGRMKIGDCRDNVLSGLGKRVFSDGSVHEGVFIDGKLCDQV